MPFMGEGNDHCKHTFYVSKTVCTNQMKQTTLNRDMLHFTPKEEPD